MPIDRAPWNALVDDDGSNLVGTVWNKDKIKTVLLDPIDALAAPAWTSQPFNAANYTASSGTWTVPGATQQVLWWTRAGNIVYVTFTIGGTMAISNSTTSLFISLPAPVPTPTSSVNGVFHYYLVGTVGTGVFEIQVPTKIRLLRDAGGTAFPVYPSNSGYFYGQLFYPCG